MYVKFDKKLWYFANNFLNFMADQMETTVPNAGEMHVN